MIVFYIILFILIHEIQFGISVITATLVWIIFLIPHHCVGLSKAFNSSDFQFPCI